MESGIISVSSAPKGARFRSSPPVKTFIYRGFIGVGSQSFTGIFTCLAVRSETGHCTVNARPLLANATDADAGTLITMSGTMNKHSVWSGVPGASSTSNTKSPANKRVSRRAISKSKCVAKFGSNQLSLFDSTIGRYCQKPDDYCNSIWTILRTFNI